MRSVLTQKPGQVLWVIRWGRKTGCLWQLASAAECHGFQLSLSVCLTGAISEIFTTLRHKMAIRHWEGVDRAVDKYQMTPWLLHKVLTFCRRKLARWINLFGKKSVLASHVPLKPHLTPAAHSFNSTSQQCCTNRNALTYILLFYHSNVLYAIFRKQTLRHIHCMLAYCRINGFWAQNIQLPLDYLY